jgi:transglutaminase-like putative cysteine protease
LSFNLQPFFMPTYRIHHLTRYTYDEPVSVCHNLAHLLPRDSARHTWHSAELEISPAPAVRSERCDFFGNRLTFFAIQEPHRQLDVIARSRVDLDLPATAPLFPSAMAWEQARGLLHAPIAEIENQKTDAAPAIENRLDAFQFSFASPYIRWTPEIAAYAAPSFAPGRPIMEAILDLTRRIHADFVYDTRTTTVSTTLPEIMQARSGVCQDFAHLQIGCLRSMGLAARYVSGYLLTSPPPGKPRLVGADASHAWVSVYLPHSQADATAGEWVDLDPTNDCIPTDKHITLAWGRDFGDVSPLRGVLLGTGKHQIQVSVDVSPVI